MKVRKVDILGTMYTFKLVSAGGPDPKLESANGYTEPYSKEIIVEELVDKPSSVRNRPAFDRKTARHEIVHAFLVESGLDVNSWGRNEEIVDWIAHQIPKMVVVMRSLGVMEPEGGL